MWYRDNDEIEECEVSHQEKRDTDYIALAKFWAERKSKDPSTQTGAVIVRPDGSIASMGYNGFPMGMDDDPELYLDRELKYKRIVHCEMNAALFTRESLKGYTLYTWPFLSCDRCAVHMIQAGIVRAVAPKLPEHLEERWGPALKLTKEWFEEAEVMVAEIEFHE